MNQSQSYPSIDWKKNEYVYIQQALTILKDVIAREDKRHQMDQDLTPSMYSLIESEIIPMIENELDVDYAPDEINEPPTTMDEMYKRAVEEKRIAWS